MTLVPMQESRSANVSLPAERLEALLFELAEQRFALPASGVIELLRACALQGLPKAPPLVLGVFNLRSEIVPVLDLRRRFGMPEKALDPGDFLILTRVAERRVALRVDRLLSIERLEVVPVSEAPNLAPGLEYVSGVAAVADGVVLIADLELFLTPVEGERLSTALNFATSERNS